MLSHRLRHRVEIQEPVDVQDPNTGVITRVWQTVALDSDTILNSVPAEVLTGPGRELHAAGTKLAETTARINIRWFPGLLKTHRILWDGRTFEIIGISEDVTARREYRINCKDGLSDGS